MCGGYDRLHRIDRGRRSPAARQYRHRHHHPHRTDDRRDAGADGPLGVRGAAVPADGSEDPGFVLNQERFRGAPILLAGPNFGCGSSREGAVWALLHSGVRCVIAPSFGDIFYNNCFQNGLLPVVLPASQVEQLAAGCAGGNARVTVDLQRQIVAGPFGAEMGFQIEALRREAMLRGLDEIGLTLLHEDAIAAFQARDAAVRPWVWQPG